HRQRIRLSLRPVRGMHQGLTGDMGLPAHRRASCGNQQREPVTMPGRMKAAIYYGIDDIRVETRPVPEIGPDDLLLKSLACGLCGGEAMPWYKKGLPTVLGHEPVGEVVEVGRNVKEFKVGERLFVNNHVGR